MTTEVHIAVIIGTARQGRKSGAVARWVAEQLENEPGVSTEVIDPRQLELAFDVIRERPDPTYQAAVDRADGLVLVVPEYNGGVPGVLKHLLDTLRHEYRRKSVGVVSVSAGSLGGVRFMPTLLPTLRGIGLVASRTDLSVPNVSAGFDREHVDEKVQTRAKSFIHELLWLTRTLQAGRASDH